MMKRKRMKGLSKMRRDTTQNLRAMMEEDTVGKKEEDKKSTDAMRDRRDEIGKRGGTYGNTLFVKLWLQVYRSGGELEDVKAGLIKKGYEWLKDTRVEVIEDGEGGKEEIVIDEGLRNVKARASRLRKKSFRKTKKGRIIKPRVLVREAIPLPYLKNEKKTGGRPDYGQLIAMCNEASEE